MSGVHGVLLGMGRPGVVTLSGETISGTATALLIVRSDGTVDKQQDVSTTQIDSGTDWIIPNGASAQPGFTVRFTVASGDTPTTGTVDSDLTLDSDRTIGFSNDEPKSCTLTVTIKHNGATVETGSYDLITLTT